MQLAAAARVPNSNPAKSEPAPGYDVGQGSLNNLAFLALGGAAVPDLAREIAQRVAEVLGADLAVVMKLTPDERALALKAGVGLDEDLAADYRVPVGTGARLGYVSQASYTMISGASVVVEDLEAEARFEGCELLKAHGMRSGITVRVDTDEGAYGLIGAHWREPREITGAEAGWLTDVAYVLGRAHQRRLSETAAGPGELRVESFIEQQKLANGRYESLRDSMSLVASAPDPRSSLEAAATLAVRRGADWCFVDLLQSGGEGRIRRLTVRHARNDEATREIARHLATHYPFDRGAPHGTPRVLRTWRPHLQERLSREDLESMAEDPFHMELIDAIRPTSYAAVPLRARGTVAGALVTVACRGRTMGQADLAVAEEIAECVSLILSGAVAGLSIEDGHDCLRDLARSAPASGAASDGPDPSTTNAVTSGAVPEAIESEGGAYSNRENPPRDGNVGVLSHRQRQVLELRAQRLSYKDIASNLGISPITAKSHMQHARTLLGITGGSNAVIAEALRLGEISVS